MQLIKHNIGGKQIKSAVSFMENFRNYGNFEVALYSLFVGIAMEISTQIVEVGDKCSFYILVSLHSLPFGLIPSASLKNKWRQFL